ncbi:hypothetical protein [Actinomadura sp. WMMB 499]|uniref:hypothetical protein n=1 Tax=Actinomadura sp. WMMB 499 TaxID=1219491 RepID=UPI0012490A9D|nr:hypothetical protein [Actinomadura sp. WMMB 499]QFG24555.1 hypothetical protein F7P10_28905 [Actinomadura sp. WMMB 499]
MPLVLPDSLVDIHRIDLAAPYSVRTSGGWGVEPLDVAAAPRGDVYALYILYRYTPGVEDDEPDPAVGNFRYRIITRYSPDGVPLATALCCPSHTGHWTSAVADGNEMTLCVLPDGVLSVNSHPDCTTLIAPDLSAVAATYRTEGRRAFEEFVPGDPFACSISATPSGRLLCMTTEYGVQGYGSSLANIVGVADGPLTADHKPSIRAVASFDPEPDRQTEDDLRPHVRFGGRAVGLRNRPRPALREIFEPGAARSKWALSEIYRPVAMSDDLFVVPMRARRGSRGGAFAFALVNDEAESTGRLQGMDPWKDSPFTGECFNVAAGGGRAFHLNRYGLFVWNADGELAVNLSTDDKAFQPLKNFTLTTCSPANELLLVHARQHLILRVPVPEDLAGLGTSVEAALAAYRKERTALKKQWAPIEWHWVQDGAQVHRL